MARSVINSEVSDILERHIESRRWMKDNYYGELTEVFRAIKMRTKGAPRKKDQAGRKTNERDKSKTDIAMPGINIAYRRGVARLTANPYKLKYSGDVDPEILEMLSALAMQQYDRSDEAKVDRRVVMQAKAFGFSYSKLRRDVLTQTMQFKRALVKNGQNIYRDRASVRKWQGVPDDEISQEVQDQGPELSDGEVGDFLQKAGYETQAPDAGDGGMSDEGMGQFIAQNGNVLTVPVDVKKYEGPVLKWIFIGDLDLQPGCISLNESDYVIESFTESDLWLQQQVKSLKYKDDQGQEIPAFDPIAVQELLDREPDKDRKIDDLREWFLGVSGRQGQDQYQFPKRLRVRKQFDLLEQHAEGEDGRNWITWICPNFRDKVIGKMPYEDDLYGKTYFTEMVLFEDLLDSYGDSTPRMMRFLHALDNRTVAQNYDMVSNLLRRFILTPTNVELGDDYVTRGNFRQLEVPDVNRVKILEEPPIPPGAFEREAIIQRRMAQVDPNLNTVDTGTASNPMAGKLATTAMLNAKASDALTQFELDGRDLYLKELGQKKLWINQQMAGDIEPWTITQQYWGEALKKRVNDLNAPAQPMQPGQQPLPAQPDQLGQQPQPAQLPQQGQPDLLTQLGQLGQQPGAPPQPQQPPQWAMSDRYGKTVAVRLDPIEIQEDLRVEPEAMSYLSVDDQLKQDAAMRLGQLAASFPMAIDIRKVARFAISTIRDIGNPDDYILPEQTAPEPPPFKGNLGVNFPMDKMPSDVVNQILVKMGMQPSEELAQRDTLTGISQMNEAGQAAGELTSSAHGENDQTPPEPKPNGKPNGKPKATKAQ